MKEYCLEKLCKLGQEYPSVIYYFTMEYYFSEIKYFLNFYCNFFYYSFIEMTVKLQSFICLCYFCHILFALIATLRFFSIFI